MSKENQLGRIAPSNTVWFPFLYLQNGEVKNAAGEVIARWAICVPTDQIAHLGNEIIQGQKPTVITELQCITPAGKRLFHVIGAYRWPTHVAPAVIEQPDEAFPLGNAIQTISLDGRGSVHPVTGVCFVDRNGTVMADEKDGKKVVLRFNRTNFDSAGGSVSQDGRTWEVTVQGTKYVGDLRWVLDSNSQRVIGSVAYVQVRESQVQNTAPVGIGESLALAPSLLARNENLTAENAQLKAEIQQLDAQIAALQARIDAANNALNG